MTDKKNKKTLLIALGGNDLTSYVVVNENDIAFKNPDKPVGPVYKESEIKNLPFPLIKTDKGYRRVVASPKPVTIVEKHEIKKLIDMDFIVICCGGGGIPVVKERRSFHGVNAVIDKDLASSKLAEEIGVDVFVIATDVEGAALNYNNKNEKFLEKIKIDTLEKYLDEGHFHPGSMILQV